MNSSKKIFALVLVFVMALTTLVLPVFAEESETFTITYTQPAGATVSLSPEGEHTENNGIHTYTYPTGTPVTITVTADDDHVLNSIKVNKMSLSGVSGQKSFSRTFSDNINLDLEINAIEFTPATSEIKVNQSELFSYTLEGVDESNMAQVGSTVVLKISPVEGYLVTKILYNNAEVTPAAEYSFTVEAENVFDITVSENTAIEQKSMTVAIEGEGSVTPDSGSFDKGSDVQLTFSANTGYIISSVTVNDSEVNITGNKYSFTINDDTNVVVKFVKSITITATVRTGGTIEINGTTLKNGSTIKVSENSDVVIRVAADLGYSIASLKIDGKTVKLDNKHCYTISSITSSKSISASFTPTTAKQYTLSASAGTGGSITPNGAQTVKEGESIPFTFTPNDGYEIDSVKLDGNVVSITNGQYKVENVATDRNIYVTFKKIESNDNPISIDKIDWTSETITIDITKNTKVSSDVFTKITNDCKDKTIVFSASNYKWTLPRGVSISTTSEYVDLALEFNAGNNYNNISALIKEKVESLNFKLISFSKSITLPENTVLSVFLGTEYSNKDIQQLIYSANENKLVNPQNSEDADIQSVSNLGWVSFIYNNDTDIILCDVLEDYYTIAASASTGGSINPFGEKKVKTGNDCTFEITANEGCVISSLLIDGAEFTDAKGKDKYTYTFKAVSTNKSIDAKFILKDNYSKSEGSNSTLIVSIIVIILAFAGAATLLIIKWRQEKY